MMFQTRAVLLFTVVVSMHSLKKSCSLLRSIRTRVMKMSTDTGHQTGSQSMTQEQEKILANLRAYQDKVPRLSMAEEVRTLIDNSLMYGTISTNSDQYPGYPTGSVVGFELDDKGLPFFVFSTMSAHTKDIAKDSRCSLTILANDFKGAAQGRVVLIGDVSKLNDAEKQAKLREKYLARHKDAYWIDFGDFSYYTMTSLKIVRYVGGFAMAGSISPEQYETASPDPIAKFSSGVIKHMNDDHADATAAMIRHYMNIPCYGAQIISMDRLGMTVNAKIFSENDYNKVRIAYPREVTERKAIKDVLVEMTRAASPN